MHCKREEWDSVGVRKREYLGINQKENGGMILEQSNEEGRRVEVLRIHGSDQQGL